MARKKKRSTRKGPDFWDYLLRDLILCALAKPKKSKRPDPYKAAGIAAGLGFGSLEDQLMLGAALGAAGAFDEPDTSWRFACEDGSAYGIDPYNYDDERMYQAALDTAKLARSLHL